MQNNWAGLIAIGVFGTVFGYVTLWYARLALDRQRRPAREIIETTIREALTAAREEGRAAGYVEGRQAAIEATRKWATNYPADIFPEPVGDAPPQSDRWHASWARHTCKQIEREILEFAPAATTEGPK